MTKMVVKREIVQGTDLQYHYAPTVTKMWRSARRSMCLHASSGASDEEIRSNDIDVTEIVRSGSDRFDRNGIEYMGLSGATQLKTRVIFPVFVAISVRWWWLMN